MHKVIGVLSALAVAATVGAADLGKFLYVGDSITAGAPIRRNQRWQVQEMMQAAGYGFTFVGSKTGGSYPGILDPWHECHQGWSSEELGKGRLTEPAEGKLAYWLQRYQPDWVYVMTGTPDTYPWLSLQQVRARLGYLADQIETYTPNAKVVWANLPDQKNSEDAWQIPAHRRNVDLVVDELAARFKAQGRQFVKLDFLRTLSPGPDLFDNVHPNELGHTKMALLNYDAIRRIQLRPTLEVLRPENVAINRGTLVDGDSGCLADQDGVELVVKRFIVPNQTAAPIELSVTAAVRDRSAAFLDAWVVASMHSYGDFVLNLDLYDYSAGSYDTLCAVHDSLGIAPARIPITATGDVSRFVSSQGTTKLRIRARTAKPSASYAWSLGIDQVAWRVDTPVRP
ncbi:MAG: hypothetical protein KIT11_10005 [Fimbriimonadaceae bacterium]|nr:hypothetical protein [Fimbriimonadaceae bacterium]QYK55657.1 MAG: hypothetical protein KF733_11675 [Fimbriimonadaceae bacterium]